jgi:5-bromo-4-chloroindolyl phosphate hydrolysis protein
MRNEVKSLSFENLHHSQHFLHNKIYITKNYLKTLALYFFGRYNIVLAIMRQIISYHSPWEIKKQARFYFLKLDEFQAFCDAAFDQHHFF